jgi:adenosylcobinamide-phosphate synthase
MDGEVAHRLIAALAPHPIVLAVAVAADLAFGDPVYPAHPIRLVGHVLAWCEARLRALGLDGYGGGILLFWMLALVSLGATAGLVAVATAVNLALGWTLAAFLVYSLLALGDLVHHVRRIERAAAAGDLPRARIAVSALVGRDTDRMDAAACRRAGVESLSENLTDGFVSPLFWYLIGGLPGLVLFKVVSTMDSMVGYKTERYLRFGWCGARLDDVMNYLPARVTWLAICAMALVVPSCSARKAWAVGLTQHALLLGPNSGWSEAATAGAIQRKIVGPIWLKGTLVTALWIGDASDPPLADGADVARALAVVIATGLALAAAACAVLLGVS